MDDDTLDKMVNAITIESITIDKVVNGFLAKVSLRSGKPLYFVFAQPRQVSEFVQERLSKLPD